MCTVGMMQSSKPCSCHCLQPKVPQHLNQCNAYSLTCVDCSRTFDRRSYAVRRRRTNCHISSGGHDGS
jgi:LYAR-type C2HC zinc finger